MRNIKLVIEYDGTGYHGWQVQPNGLTVQEVIEKKIELMTRQNARLIASGRTDAGVHALAQVANFKTISSIPVDAFRRGLNSLLPSDIVIKSAEEIDEEFHSQHAAKRKIYLYRIWNSPIPSAVHRNFSWHIPGELNLRAMQDASSILKGKKDFSTFQGTGADTEDPVREVFRAEWIGQESNFLRFTIEADGFLKNMVRNIVGTLIAVGKEKLSPKDFEDILAARDRRLAGMTAPARGLFLIQVVY